MNSIDYATLTKQGFELKAKREADHALGKLVTETQIGYNASTNEITFESGITTHSNCICAPTMKSAAGMSSKTGLPVIKGSITVPEIRGKVDKYFYVANSLGIEIEITPRPPSQNLNLYVFQRLSVCLMLNRVGIIYGVVCLWLAPV